MRLIKGLVALAVLWCLAWAVMGFGLRQAVSGWFEARAQDGWQAELSDVALAGFPLRHRVALGAPMLADPATGVAWSADTLSLESPAFRPGQQTVAFAATPQRLSYFDQTVSVVAEALVAQMHLGAGGARELHQLAATSGPWQARSETEGDLVGAEGLTLAMIQSKEAAQVYQFDFRAPALRPGPVARKWMASAKTLPETFDELVLDMEVTFDRPWDMGALEQTRPQPRVIVLRRAEVAWGALRALAAGQVSVDAAGIPTGSITIKAENWREMLEMAAATGRVPDGVVRAAEKGLGFLARMGGNPNALDLTLGMQDGFVTLGPLPLGPAPRLILR